MSNAYPIRIEGTPAPQLNRGLWLVKWFLLIPHAIVLFFLAFAFAALTVVAFFAILLTGRYPRSIFDFNVGVLRWSWRVWFYGYYALGTDQYPPFTLHDVPDYPARLEVDYPAELSRGLVLVKSWLLALPHYLVLSFFAGSGLYLATGSGDDHRWAWGGGLIVLLTLIAAIALLFTGRYPRPIFDLVMGLDRWLFRVVGYAALMTDQYPPFRLDQGPEDQRPAAPEPEQLPSPGRPRPPGRGWTALPIVGLVLGSFAVLVAFAAGAGASVLIVADHGLRDSDGYLMSGRQTVVTADYAVSTEDLEIHVDAGTGHLPYRLLGTVKVSAESENGQSLFVGIARSEQVSTYLAGVAHAVIVDLDGPANRLEPRYRYVAGDAPAMVPGTAEFWAASASGDAVVELLWEPEGGDWVVVVMNADASAEVQATMRVGATVPVLGWGVGALLGLVAVFLLLGAVLLVLAVHWAHAPVRGAASTTENEGSAP